MAIEVTKIMFLARSLDTGGAERQLVTLATGLKARGVAVSIALFYGGGALEGEALVGGVQLHHLGKQGRWESLSFMRRLVKVVRHEAPDMVHAYLGPPNIMVALLRPFFAGAKVVWGVRASFMDLKNYDWLHRVAFRLEAFLSRYAHLIIVNAEAGRRYAIENGFSADRMVVIPNGVDTERFAPDTEARKNERAALGVTAETLLIGLPARLDPMKDHAIFLEAAALLCAERSDLRFLIVGGGEGAYAEKIKTTAERLRLGDRLIWLGVRRDMESIYNALDIVALTSKGEGFPNALVEAMACGVPVVATNVGDVAAIVGDTGVVVEPQDAYAFAEGLRQMIKRRDDSVPPVRERIVEKYGVNTLVTHTLERLAQV